MNGILPKFERLLISSNPFNSQVRLKSELFVSRLSFYTTKEEFQSMFSPFGIVKEARLVMDPRTRRPKGFGFVEFEAEDEAQRALKALNGRIVRGRFILVEFAKNREESN